MIDRIVVVDSGQVIETTESAIIAKDEADRAEKWAKYSEEQANLASNNAIAAAASKEAAAQSAQSAANTVNGFDVHAAQKQQAFNNNATSKTNTYNSNASTLLQQYNNNAAQKLSAYNSNNATKTQAFNDNYTSKLNSFNTNASKKQAQVDASAEEARKWAVGTISEQPNGSAKYWAGQAKTSTAGTLNESILTNCLTEIPQDIKWEFTNGILKLKAGSKISFGYREPIILQKDLQIGRNSSNAEFIMVNSDGLSVNYWRSEEVCYSGSKHPTVTGKAIYYNTDDRHFYYTTNSGSDWTQSGVSLPILLVQMKTKSPYVETVLKTFNGFGYIGNNTFILPGVKCKRTNGFNVDGSLNSIETTITKVTIPSFDTEVDRPLYFINGNNSAISNFVSGNVYVYDKSINNFILRDTKEVRNLCFAYSVTKDSTGRITSLTPNTAFHAVDYSEYARELDNKVSKTGNETIEGIKTFSQGDIRGKTSTDSHYGVARYATFDKDGVQYSDLWITRSEQGNSNGISYAGLRVSDSSGSVSNRVLAIYKKKNSDDIVTIAPTPQTSDNSTQIATTAWVNNKFKKVSTLPAQPDPNVTYLIPEE